MLGTAPSGSVQLQDYCVRPEKIGEPFFHSLSEVKSSSEMPSRTEVPGTPFRTLQKKGRFSSRYRILPQTHADVLKHLWLPIPPSPKEPGTA